jgi:DNA-binding GntR family transcriptional regulator
MSASVRPLRRRTLAVEVADRLREMILTGELSSGSRTTQDELARMLGVSTMPVREALLRLAAEGFVHAEPNRSFTITPTSREDVQDVYWMHAVLAGELTRRACERADDALVAALRERAARCHEVAGSGNAELLEEANWEFHRAINLAARAPKLLVVLRATLRFIPRGFYGLLLAWTPTSEAGHEAILRAFERRDSEAARIAAEQHVRDAGQLLVELFTTRGYWERPRAVAQTESEPRRRMKG